MPESSKSASSRSTGDFENIPNVLKAPTATDPDRVIFPEWSDHDVNIEKWEMPNKKGSPKGHPEEGMEKYLDPHHIQLPHSLKNRLSSWKRIDEVFPQVNVSLYKESSNSSYSDFLSGSSEILESEFMTDFISSVGILEYLGNTSPWPQETPSPTYTPTTNDPWKPWHHVYSNGKVGKGQTHQPQLNKYGKYIVRLYWMGCWRKITIDDRLPVDSEGRALLPTLLKNINFETDDPTYDKMGEVEMWPLLLSKALIKIACFTWSEENEINQFSIITSLTGWILQDSPCEMKDYNMLWKFFYGHTDNIPNKIPAEKGKENRKDGKASDKKVEHPKKIQPYCLTASVKNLNEYDDAFIHDVTPCMDHTFLVDQTCEILPENLCPLVWLQYRLQLFCSRNQKWDYYTVGLIKIVSAFRQFSQEETCFLTPSLSVDFEISVETIVESLVESDQPKPDVEKSLKTSKTRLATKATKSTNGSPNKGRKLSNIEPPPDPSVWCDFNIIKKFITGVQLYIRPSQFKYHVRISDLDLGATTKLGENNTKYLVWPANLKLSHKKPLYLLSDSLDCNPIHINLAHNGNQENLTTDENIVYNISYVSFEEYDWRTETIRRSFAEIFTTGSKSVTLTFEHKRTLIKISIKTKSSYVLDIISNGEFHVGTNEEIFERMADDSKQLLHFSENISTLFHDLVESFGKADFQTRLQNFNNSYKPDTRMSLKLKETINEQFLFTLKCVFYDSHVDTKFFEALDILLLNITSSEIKQDYICQKFDETETAANIIQSFFKMLHVKKVIGYHKPENKKHHGILVALRKFSREVFTPKFVAKVMRVLLLLNPHVEEVKNIYDFYPDLQLVVHNQSYVGTLSPNLEGWIALARFSFTRGLIVDGIVKILLFCNNEQYLLRVFNNDSLQEVRRITNNSCVGYYEPNEKGYTILAYTKAINSEPIKWKVSFITLKRTEKSDLIIQSAMVDTEIITNHYRPNLDKLIFRCRVFARKDSDLTFRLTCSHKQAVFKLIFANRDGFHIDSIIAIGCGILPLSKFSYNPETDSENCKRIDFKNISLSRSNIDSFHIIEAYVLRESWPLTSGELSVAADLIDRNAVGDQLLDEATNRPVKQSQAQDASKFVNTQTPFWCLDTIHNSKDPILVVSDGRRDDQIYATKMTWFRGQEERYNFTMELREKYFEQNYIEVLDYVTNYDTWSNITSGSLTLFSNDLDLLMEALDNLKIVDDSLFNVQSVIRGQERYLQRPHSVLSEVPSMDFASYYYLDNDAKIRHVKMSEEQAREEGLRCGALDISEEDVERFKSILKQKMEYCKQELSDIGDIFQEFREELRKKVEGHREGFARLQREDQKKKQKKEAMGKKKRTGKRKH